MKRKFSLLVLLLVIRVSTVTFDAEMFEFSFCILSLVVISQVLLVNLFYKIYEIKVH